jgi:hypothetical protein
MENRRTPSDEKRTLPKPRIHDNGTIRQLTTGEIDQLEPENEETRCIIGPGSLRTRE